MKRNASGEVRRAIEDYEQQRAEWDARRREIAEWNRRLAVEGMPSRVRRQVVRGRKPPRG